MNAPLKIPKVVHFTWFSNDPYPPVVENCMATWKEKLPDYEFIHWNMDRLAEIDNKFLRQALEKRKWAFAADMTRVYALYTYGGIYLDTDVEVYKSFDPLLSNEAFIGRETSYHLDGRRTSRYLTSHCMGGIQGHPFFKACLDYYKGRSFVLSDVEWLPPELKYDQKILPFIQYEIAKLQGFNPSTRIKGIQRLDNGLAIYPSDYFDCYYQVKDAYCRHLALGGWRDKAAPGTGLKDTLKSRSFVMVHKLFGSFNLSVFKNL